MPSLPALLTPPVGPLNVMGGPIGAGSFNGFVWGPGTNVFVDAVSGLDDLPTVRTFDADRGYDHGEWQGVDFVSGRDITLTFQVRANSTLIGDTARNADMTARLALLMNAMVPQNKSMLTSTELPLLLYNNTRFCNVKVRKRTAPYASTYLADTVEVTVLFHSTSERILSVTQQAFLSALILNPSVGRTYPRTYNYSYGGLVGAPPLTVVNNGNWPARPVCVIFGPCLNPQIANISSGLTIQFNLQLNIGDVLVVDMDAKVAWLNGTVSRRSTLSFLSSWWELAPGSSQIQFAAAEYGSGAQMALTFNDCWV